MANKKLRFGYDTSTSLHEILRSDYEIVEKPLIISYGNKVEMDIDFYIIIDGNANDDIENYILKHCELLDIPVFGIRRLKKSLQYNYLKKFGINCPKIYFQNPQMNEFNLVNILQYVDDNCELVIKLESGARGIGQMLINKRDFIQLLSKHDIYGEKQRYENSQKNIKYDKDEYFKDEEINLNNNDSLKTFSKIK